jgi:hypothetical protein
MISRYRNRKGQVLVEYLLLMVIAVGCATLLLKPLVGRDAAKPGIITGAWQKILNNIGEDIPDCLTPNCS